MGQFPPCKASEAHPPGQLREKCPLRDRGHNRTCRSGRKISELRVPESPFYPCTSFGPAPHIADLIRCRHYPDMGGTRSVIKFVNHSATVLEVAVAHGWLPGARYTNLRDVKRQKKLGFLDIDWKRYDFQRHLETTAQQRPLMTVARDVEDKRHLKRIIDQAYRLLEYASYVIVVPKDPSLGRGLCRSIPSEFILGFSVPTRYGGTQISPFAFKRPVHLLGGRPDVQRRMADLMPVFSIDANRFTLDASFGDFFDGDIFRPHPKGGYRNCLVDSVKNITALWTNYVAANVEASHAGI